MAILTGQCTYPQVYSSYPNGSRKALLNFVPCLGRLIPQTRTLKSISGRIYSAFFLWRSLPPRSIMGLCTALQRSCCELSTENSSQMRFFCLRNLDILLTKVLSTKNAGFNQYKLPSSHVKDVYCIISTNKALSIYHRLPRQFRFDV
ncbi:hypothetical protein TNCT_115131 [Trichonephila clavata]|uniref:Uncharacterized protein n=1 Tax=Trichonephila clavata TaxID=2740835 RepID=A0A8X6LZS9_TRICU|nr:hypothetical protein TNCT_115131 [Trichonephila clavata]